jgi:hypothetical protein
MPDYNNYPSWWQSRFSRRLGDAASATTSTAQREPLYGVAVDVAMSPLSDATARGVLDQVQGYTEDVAGQRAAAAQMRQPGPTSLAQVKEQIRFQAQQIEQAVRDRTMSPAQAQEMKEQATTALVDGLLQNRDQYGLSDEDVEKIQDYFAGEDEEKIFGIPRKLRLISKLSGVDEKTGLNRTERKWLRAMSAGDSDISWQEDATLDPALEAPARRALEGGEWSPELAQAYAEYQGNPAKDKLLEGLEWLDVHVQQPIHENASAAVIALDQWGDLKSDLEGTPWADIWREARDAANNVSFGQAFADAITQDPDESRRAYRVGFDENGQPLDQAYYDRRQGAVYNAGSGLVDFAFTWYADPTVVIGKTAGAARALARADVANLPPAMRNRFLSIATTPSDELAEAGTRAQGWNPLDRRALAVRQQMQRVRDQVRSGEIDELGLSKLQAFKDDPVAVQFFAHAARAKKIDPTGRLGDEFDDDVFDTFVAASYGHGPALQKLAERDDALRDLAKALEPQVTRIDEDIARLENDYERALEYGGTAGASSFDAWRRVHEARFDLGRAVDEKDLLEGQLAQYDSYSDFSWRFLETADKPTLRNARLTESVISQTFRTSAINANGVEVTRYPLAAFRKRPGNVDLTRGGETVEGASRYFDQMARYSDATALTTTAVRRKHDSWEALKGDVTRRLLSASNDTERRKIMAEIEDIGVETIAVKHGLSAENALRISNTVKVKRNNLYATMLRQKDEAGRAQATPGEQARDVFTYEEGGTVRSIQLPVSVTELQNYYVPADLRTLDGLLNVHGDAIRSDFAQRALQAGEAGTDLLEKFNSFWKPAVLLRLGYPIRNVTDGQLRALALTGSFGTLIGGGAAAATGTLNTGSRLLNQFPRLARRRGRLPMIPQIGTGAESTIRVRGREVPAAFARGEGDVFKSLSSSDEAQRKLFRNDLAAGRAALAGLRASTAGDPGHLAHWAHVLNERVTKDPIWRQMLAGKEDDEIVRWLGNTTEGRALRRRVPWRSYDAVRWVDELRTTLNTYAPDDVLRAKLAADEVVSEAELQKLADIGLQPAAIDEAAVEIAQGSGPLADWVGAKVDQAYHLLATLPEDTLVRQPFFRAQYRARLNQLTAHLDDRADISPKALRAFKNDARQHALKQSRRYLFTLADSSDLTHYFRFIAPFGAAATEAIRKWGRIFLEEPEAFARLYVNGWADLNDAAFWELVDQNGLTEDDEGHGPLESLRMQVPKSVLKKLDWLVPGDFSGALDVWAPEIDADIPAGLTPAEADRFKKATQGHIGFNVSKKSLNVSLQGDPFFVPGVGPWVQIPAGFFASRYPELADEDSFRGAVYRYLFLVGIQGPETAVLPAAWMRQLWRGFRGIEDPVFTNMADNLLKQAYQAWEASGRQGPAPDVREITEMTKLSQFIFAAARFGSPVSYQMQPGAQMFIDAARAYQQALPFGEAYARYVRDFGDEAYVWWSSNSQTNVAVPATSAGARAERLHRALIEEHPDIALLIVGLETEDAAFNYAAYDLQGDTPVSPWDPTPRRERLSPEEAIAKAEAQRGWAEWRQVNTAITAELAARGLTSIQQTGAEDLAALKRAAREDIGARLPGWAADQATFDKDRTYRIVAQIRDVLQQGKAPIRADWEGWSEYIDLHDTIAAELDARAAAGGSRNIEAGSNADLAHLYAVATGDLGERNLQWADAFARTLDLHVLSNGSN